ncbi:MAG: ATP-binding protein [Chlorobi bacterium]|nr:ATP-binding protein [Chlorobiota bacterium]
MNPFTLNYEPEYFCDRQNELARLSKNISNGRNTLIHSPRRLGKSALIKHFFHTLEKKKNFETIFIDLFATTSLEGFIQAMAENILFKYHSKNFIEGVKTLLKGLSPNISFSPDGTPGIGLSVQPARYETTLKELFNYLETRKKKVIIAFDEFQEVAGYPEKGEAVLRTYIQNLSNVRFIFSGSSNHLLQQMFFSAKRPFYQSVEIMVLDKINRETYFGFIKDNFEKNDKQVAPDALEYLLDFSEIYTYYTQVVCNYAFSETENKLELQQAYTITDDLIENRKADYQSLLRLLPENQRKVAIAVANEGIIKKPTAIDFILKHRLPSVSSVAQALKSLENKEIICLTNDGYTVYDVFFKRFLQRYYGKELN